MNSVPQSQPQGNFVVEAILDKVLDKVIAYHRIFATIGGGATEGLFLSQAYYWSKRTKDPEGWFYKTQEEWHKETALTRREIEVSRKKLIAKGIIEEQRKGLPAKLFYRVNIQELYNAIINESTSNPHGCQIAKSDKPERHKLQTALPEVTNNDVISDKQSIYTENTSIDYLHRLQQQTATAAATCVNQNDENLSLEPKILENQEQALGRETLDPHEKTISQNSETHHIVDSPEDYSTNESTPHEDKSCGSAAHEVVMTSTCNKLISVILENGGITQNSKVLQIATRYSIEQIGSAIAYLEIFEQDRMEAVDNPEGFFVDALRGDWAVDYMARKGFTPEMRKLWITGHTARLLGIAAEFDIETNNLALNSLERRVFPLDAIADGVKSNGWERVMVMFEEYCRQL